MVDEPYELVLARPAARAIADELPESIATAVINTVSMRTTNGTAMPEIERSQ